MTQVNLPNTLQAGTPENVADVQENDEALRDGINGNLDGFNLTQAARERLGISDPTAVRSGSSIIATGEAITSGSYTALATPDRVANVVVPTGGLLLVSFWASLLKSVGGSSDTASMGVFLNGVIAKNTYGLSSLEITGLSSGFAASASELVYTTTGLAGIDHAVSGSVNPTDNTTAGHPVGTFLPIRVTAGTYTVEVRWLRAAGGTITAQNRLLFVESRSY